jgi:formylglycine-generating enzyme required for sulfatase activity
MEPLTTSLVGAFITASGAIASGSAQAMGEDIWNTVKGKLTGWRSLEADATADAFKAAVRDALRVFRAEHTEDATAEQAIVLLTSESPEAVTFRNLAVEELVFRARPNLGRLMDYYRREWRFLVLLRGEEIPPWETIAPYLLRLIGNILPRALAEQEPLRPLLLEQAELQALDEARATTRATEASANTLARIESLLRELVAGPLSDRHMHAANNIIDSQQFVIHGNYYQIPPISSPDLKSLYARYRAFVTGHFGDLDFRGIMQVQNAVKLALEDIYVPLKGDAAGSLLQQRSSIDIGANYGTIHTSGMGMDTIDVIGVNFGTVIFSPAIPLHDQVRDTPRLVILGDPGTGKSTLVRYILLALTEGHAHARLDLADEWLPIFFPIAAFAEARSDPGQRDLAPLDYLRSFYMGLSQPDYTPLFQRALLSGRALLLFDGLDEVREDRLSIVRCLEAFVREWDVPGNRFVATSRIAGYDDAPLDDRLFVQTRIQPFDDDDIRLFAHQWSRAYERAGLREPADDVALVEAELERRASEYADSLVAAIFDNPHVTDLARNPLLLTILALIHNQGTRLPDRRVDLYKLCVEALAESWNRARSLSGRPINIYLGNEKLDERFVVNLLGPVALWIHDENPGGLVEQPDLVRELERTLVQTYALPSGKARGLAEDFITLVHQHTGLIQERGHRLYGFLHLTFEEYLAGRALLESEMVDDPDEYVHERAAVPGWREVLRLMVASATLREAGRWLLHLLEAPAPSEHRGRPVVLAGECLLDLGTTGAPQKARTAVIERLLDLIVDPQVPVALRIEGGHVLGRLGDPRLLDPATGTSPDGRYWCPIEAGEFWYGDDRPDDDEDTEEDEEVPELTPEEREQRRLAKLQQMHLDYAFQIARFPVTNAEYARFIDTGGYEQQEWWTEQGWIYISPEGARGFWDNDYKGKAITLPRYWDDNRFNNPAQPVVGVSWYEAAAYCRWLTAQGHAQGWLPKEQEIRLPTSLEWERAARHTDQRPYPWGWEEPTPERANYDATGIGRPSPVGCFAAGAAVCGAQDMAGNVLEWLATPYGQSEQAEPKKDFTPLDGALVTWSAWGFGGGELLCGSRVRFIPYYWDGIQGFRVLQSLRSSV